MRISVKMEPSACILGALLLLSVPLKWLIAALFAAVFHELFHILAIKLVGGHIWALRIGISGAVIDTEPLSRGKELICAIAGPAGSLLLLLCFRWIPRTALCAGVQACFNLLPLFPLDGGRILRSATELLLSPKIADSVCRYSEGTVVLGVGVLAVIGSVWYHLGLMPLILAAVLLTRAFLRKIPCNAAQLGVQ